MKTGTDDKRKQLLAGVLGTIALLLVGYQLFGLFGGDSTPPRPAAPVITTVPAGGKAGRNSGPAAIRISSSTALDPSLHMEPMIVTESLVYTGSGRNIFAAGNEPGPVAPKMVTAKFDARPKPPAINPQTTPPPYVPPSIPLKFFGTDTAQNGTRRAFLLNGDDVYVASVGDVVERRYRVVEISADQVYIEDIPNTNKQHVQRTLAP